MTNEELNEWLAVHIMGYEKLPYPAVPKYQKPTESGIPNGLWDWNPCENIAHAYAVMGKMLFMKVENSNLPLAICTAIYDAMKDFK